MPWELPSYISYPRAKVISLHGLLQVVEPVTEFSEDLLYSLPLGDPRTFWVGSAAPLSPPFLSSVPPSSCSHIGLDTLSFTFGPCLCVFSKSSAKCSSQAYLTLSENIISPPCSQISVLNHRKAACSNVHYSCLKNSVGLPSFPPPPCLVTVLHWGCSHEIA